MIQQKNYNVGDFVKDKLGNEWEVLRYKVSLLHGQA